MEHLVTGCNDCPYSSPFPYNNGEREFNWCMCPATRLDTREEREIKQLPPNSENTRYTIQYITPDWCPLKSNEITIKLINQ